MIIKTVSQLLGKALQRIIPSSKSNSISPSAPDAVSTEALKALKPVAVADIGHWVLFERKQGTMYCVGSLSVDKYITVPADKLTLVMETIDLMDGCHSIGEIQTYHRQKYAKEMDVVQFYNLLQRAALILDPPPDPEQVSKSEFLRLSTRLISVDLEWFFRLARPLILVLRYPLLLITAVIIMGGISIFPVNALFSPNSYQLLNSYSIGLVAMLVGVSVAVFLHEFSHSIVAVWYGLTPRSLKVVLYLGFSMFFFVQIPGIYTLKPGQRIKIWLAGVYANAFLGCLLLLVRQFASPGSQQDLLMNLALSNFILVAGNLYPFVPTDGYFLLTTILKIPNLRSDAFEVIRSAVSGGNIRIRLSVVAYLIVSLTIIIKFIIMQGYWLARMMRELLFSRPTHLTFEYILKAGVVLLIVITIVNVVSRQFKRFRRRKLSST
ncbi:MAG: hypothetical protein KKF00_03070 [Proteobacteria bacterium]|nr:hypothetical protein [Pseudomonadota bacterium]